MDVDAEVIDVMKARLREQDFYKTYDSSEHSTTPTRLEQERKKLKNIFNNHTALVQSFSSLQNTKKTLKAMKFYKVDRKFLADYADQKSSGPAVDEFDFYAWLLFNKKLVHKCERIKNYIYFLGVLDATEHLHPEQKLNACAQDAAAKPICEKNNFSNTQKSDVSSSGRLDLYAYASQVLERRRDFIGNKLWPLLDEYQHIDFNSLGQTKSLRQWAAPLELNRLLHTFYNMAI